MGKYQAVIFDLDGVICFTDEYHYRAWKRIADELDIPFDRTVNNRLRGVSRMESLEIILENNQGEPFSDAEKQSLASDKNELYKELLTQMSEKNLSAEVKETLDTLRTRGLSLAIGSSSKSIRIFRLDTTMLPPSRIDFNGLSRFVASGQACIFLFHIPRNSLSRHR